MVPNNMDALEWLRKHLDAEGSDLLREMVRTFAERLMAAEVEVLCNAGYGEITPERTNSRNGYRPRQLDTGSGRSICRSRSCARAATTRAGCSAAPARRAGAGRGGRRVLRARCRPPAGSRAGAGPRHRAAVEEPGRPWPRARRRGDGVPQPAARCRPYTYVSLDALPKGPEGGRIVNVAVVIASASTPKATASPRLRRHHHRGRRRLAGVPAFSWPALAGTTLVISDAHPGLIDPCAPH